MKIKNVTIIGGGSSGWMTAAALSKLCPHLDITLVESKNFKTIGVGESTLGHFNRFLEMLDLTDDMWMKDCNATYKNSIRFTNFRENDGSSFEYPFGSGYDFTDASNGLSTWSELATLYPNEFTPDTFAKMYESSNTALAIHNKQTDNASGKLRHFDFKNDTAYHLDATLFGQWLKNNVAIPNGVTHLLKDVHSYNKDSKGNITQILCSDGHHLSADLWIDCTGFKSLLLEQWMGQQFLPFDKHLANDSAWACRVPYINRELEMHNVTDCHALGNGWVWNIPLWNRIGTGYVFSSKFTTSEDAKKEFIKHLSERHSPEIAKSADMFLINIRHGRRRKAFVENVVGIGLSYGFVEPLESTGLLTTHENIIKLVDMLNRREGYITRTEKDGYNFSVERDVLSFRDFVSMHYALSQRTDTAYWKWCTQINEYCPTMFNDFVPQLNSYANLIGGITANNLYQEQLQGANYIAAGMGVKAISTPSLVRSKYSSSKTFNPLENNISILEDARNRYHKNQKSLDEYMKTLPSHYEYLKENIYNGVDIHEGNTTDES